MSEHQIVMVWNRTTPDFSYKTYSRDHEWRMESGAPVKASSAPGYHGNLDLIDPEQGFVASIASCHMLWFLHLACDKGLIVDHYEDPATGVLEAGSDGRMQITQVRLAPTVKFGGEQLPTADEIRALHHEAHEKCFIAHSVRSTVTVKPVF